MNSIWKPLVLCGTMSLLLFATAWAGSFPEGSLKAFDAKVDVLLKQMTLEEKVGQMTQVTIDVVSQGADGRLEPHDLDPGKLENAILKYHVGSILNVGPSGYTVSHWQDVITKIQDL